MKYSEICSSFDAHGTFEFSQSLQSDFIIKFTRNTNDSINSVFIWQMTWFIFVKGINSSNKLKSNFMFYLNRTVDGNLIWKRVQMWLWPWDCPDIISVISVDVLVHLIFFFSISFRRRNAKIYFGINSNSTKCGKNHLLFSYFIRYLDDIGTKHKCHEQF